MATVRRGKPQKTPSGGAITALSPTATGPTDFAVVETGLYDPRGANLIDIFGLDAAGNRVDLGDTITLVIVSSDPTVIVASPPFPDVFKVTPLKPGSATLTVTLTYKNGKAGPFTITIPVIVAGILGVAELEVVLGNVTIA